MPFAGREPRSCGMPNGLSKVEQVNLALALYHPSPHDEGISLEADIVDALAFVLEIRQRR